MERIKRALIKGLVAAVVCAFAFSISGCAGYVKNARDDFMDMGTFAVGATGSSPPPEKGEKATGQILPIGIYVQATDIFHLGALRKTTTDLDWDRRGLAVVKDDRAKYSFGPGHFVRINQAPVFANAYKAEQNELDGWREYMRQWEGPIAGSPAKELIFRQSEDFLPYFYKGWGDWDAISLELALSEPFILHAGFYVRAGVHPAQAVDFVLSLFSLDFIYNDNAYKKDGSPRF